MASSKKLAEQNVFERLALVLPDASAALAGDDLDLRARAVLAILLDRVSGGGFDAFLPSTSDPRVCPNCNQPADSKTSPYCSDCCRQEAAFVRQMRDSLANGTIFDEHRQTMKGEVLWRLLGAGLPRRLALVPEKARERVFKRTEGKCEICGAPATTIDNTGSG